jgi:acyl carrier protein
MNYIRNANESDFDTLASFEVEISEISFGDKAITSKEFHKKKFEKTKDRTGMMVIVSEKQEVMGWLWMSMKTNSLTEEKYVNFKSFYISPLLRGEPIVGELMKKGIKYAEDNGAEYIVGNVNVNNIEMRSVYRNFDFVPMHITMQLNLNKGEKNNFDKILEIVCEYMKNDLKISADKTTVLLGKNALLTSLSVLQLVAWCEEKFDIKNLLEDDLMLESVKSVTSLVNRIIEKGGNC